MRAGLAGAVVALGLASAGPAVAHGVVDRVVDAPATVVRFAWATGGPVVAGGYRLFGPGDATPWLTGRTDADGRIAFVADRPGTWRVELQADPEHKVSRSIEIGPGQTAESGFPWQRALLTVSVAANGVLAWLLWSRRRAAAASSAASRA